MAVTTPSPEASPSAAQPAPRAVRLLDGAELRVRPVAAEDKDLLQDAFSRLSATSRYRRFFTAVHELAPAELRYFTELDHHDHEALVALDVRDGRAAGVARYVRAPTDRCAAELAVAVCDDWHRRGVGTALLALLIDRARAEGIRRFTGLVLSDNGPMRELLDEFGDARVLHHEAGVVELVFDLPAAGLGSHLPELLRAAARGELHLRPPGRRAASG